jgi:hypothetical protein
MCNAGACIAISAKPNAGSTGYGSIRRSSASGRLPDTGDDLCSQPTVSRWENAPSLRDLIRLMGVMVDLYCISYAVPPASVTLDIDDTVNVVHGHQQPIGRARAQRR